MSKKYKRKIAKLVFYNINKKVLSHLDLDKQVTIVTGYNGTGKSTLLSAFYSAISSNKFAPRRTNLAIDLFDFSGDMITRMITLESNKSVREDEVEDFLESHADKKSLDNVYGLIEDFISKDKKNSSFTVSKYNKDKTDSKILSNQEALFVKFENKKQEPYVSIYYSDGALYIDGIEITEEIDSVDYIVGEKNILSTFYKIQYLLSSYLISESKSLAQEKIKDKEFIRLLDVISSSSIFLTENSKATPNEMAIDLIASVIFKKLSGNFSNIVNNLLKHTNKTIEISSNGVIFLKEGDSKVDFFGMSKGEKSIILLLCLAFLNRELDTFIVLDEPETSLHIEWQEMLLPSILEIAPKTNILMATHSAAMLGNTSDERIVNMLNL